MCAFVASSVSLFFCRLYRGVHRCVVLSEERLSHVYEFSRPQDVLLWSAVDSKGTLQVAVYFWKDATIRAVLKHLVKALTRMKLMHVSSFESTRVTSNYDYPTLPWVTFMPILWNTTEGD